MEASGSDHHPFPLQDLVLDVNSHKLTLSLPDVKLVFQAIDPYSYSGMELVLDRCTRIKPDLVMLPINGRLINQNENTLLQNHEAIDKFIDEEILVNKNLYKESKAERAIQERVNSLRKMNVILSTLY